MLFCKGNRPVSVFRAVPSYSGDNYTVAMNRTDIIPMNQGPLDTGRANTSTMDTNRELISAACVENILLSDSKLRENDKILQAYERGEFPNEQTKFNKRHHDINYQQQTTVISPQTTDQFLAKRLSQCAANIEHTNPCHTSTTACTVNAKNILPEPPLAVKVQQYYEQSTVTHVEQRVHHNNSANSIQQPSETTQEKQVRNKFTILLLIRNHCKTIVS